MTKVQDFLDPNSFRKITGCGILLRKLSKEDNKTDEKKERRTTDTFEQNQIAPTTITKSTPTVGDTCQLHYDLYLEPDNGEPISKLIDSTYEKGMPLQFIVGQEEIIIGLDTAIQQMTIGEQYEVTIPSCYAYGETGLPPMIPPNSVLLYRTEIFSIRVKEESGRKQQHSIFGWFVNKFF